MRTTLESRLAALEKAAANTGEVTIIRLVGVSPDGTEDPPAPFTRLGSCVREPGETDEQLYARATAGMAGPHPILLAS